MMCFFSSENKCIDFISTYAQCDIYYLVAPEICKKKLQAQFNILFWFIYLLYLVKTLYLIHEYLIIVNETTVQRCSSYFLGVTYYK